MEKSFQLKPLPSEVPNPLSDAAIRKRLNQSPMENYKKLVENGRKLKHSLRSLVNALLYITKS